MGFHSPLIRPYLLGGGSFGGGTLGSHDICEPCHAQELLPMSWIRKNQNFLLHHPMNTVIFQLSNYRDESQSFDGKMTLF